jgi:cytochrome P450
MFAAMANYPLVQKKAQEELDKVFGDGRLPTFEDRPYLPYISAVVKEVLRWHVNLSSSLLFISSLVANAYCRTLRR